MSKFQLFDIPVGSKLHIMMDNNSKKVFTFHRLDGHYSYCTLDEDPSKVLHLSAITPLENFDDGYKILGD